MSYWGEPVGTRGQLTVGYPLPNPLVLDVVTVPDMNANGSPDIALLMYYLPQSASCPGQVRVGIRDSLSGALIKNLWYGAQYEPIAIEVMNDYSGNGSPARASNKGARISNDMNSGAAPLTSAISTGMPRAASPWALSPKSSIIAFSSSINARRRSADSLT